MHKFIVLSDLHIVPEGKLSHGLDTAERSRLVIDHINQRHSDAAFCVFAGDLADHGEPEAYARLKPLTDTLTIPAYFTLGNHDARDAFLQVFGMDHASATGHLDRAITLGDLCVIVLDTLVQGAHEGGLCDSQYDWLKAQLAQAKDNPVVVVMHHAICPLGVPTDFINLTDQARFAETLATHGNVQQVITGHVHMSTAGVTRGIPFTTIAGCHYNIFPQRHGPLDSIPRLYGPGQIGVVLASETGVVVHHENAIDRHEVLDPALFAWNRDD